MLYVPRLPNVIAQAQIPKVPFDKSPAVGSIYEEESDVWSGFD